MEMKTLYAIFQINGTNVFVVQTGFKSTSEAEHYLLNKVVGDGCFIQSYYSYV